MPSDKTKMNTLKIISRFPFSKISRAVRKSYRIFPRKFSVKPPIVRVHNVCLEKLSDNNNNNLLFFIPHFFLIFPAWQQHDNLKKVATLPVSL